MNHIHRARIESFLSGFFLLSTFIHIKVYHDLVSAGLTALLGISYFLIAYLNYKRDIIKWDDPTALIRTLSELTAIKKAAKELYYAAHWTADRPVDSEALWTKLRDACGIIPGSAPKQKENG